MGAMARISAPSVVDLARGALDREHVDERARWVGRRVAAPARDGVSIYLAPEGTRSRDGSIGKLKKGGFHLAKETGAPIVPVAIRGTIDILPRGTRVMHTGKRVDLTIGAPLDSQKNLDEL